MKASFPGGGTTKPETTVDKTRPEIIETEGGVLVYDAEIKRCIPTRGDDPLPGVEYCEGWGDHVGMGIACIGAYDFLKQRYRIFFEDNLDDFRRLIAQRQLIIGFNNWTFDDKLCIAHGVDIPREKSADLIDCIKQASPTRGGWKNKGLKLDKVYRANFPNGQAKTGDGAHAPVLWQTGRRGEAVDYCLNDIQMTVELLMLACATGTLLDPDDVEGPPIPVREYLPTYLVDYQPWHQLVPTNSASN